MFIDETEVPGPVGFTTWVDITNAGFYAGDSVNIRVVDKWNTNLRGSVSLKMGSLHWAEHKTGNVNGPPVVLIQAD